MPEKKQIERIYSLSPMQEGMLYHSLIDENSSAYFEQFCIRIEGKLDIRLFESSFNEIIKRYEALRTIFIYEKIKSPKQVVIKSYKTKIHFEDISRFINEKKEEHIKKFRKKEIKKGFDLTKGSLVRLAIFKNDDSRYILIWSFHHIIMDGWCLGILYRDLINIYFSLKKEIPIQLQPTVPYRNFIQWLRRQDKSQATSYWKKYLEEYDHQDLMNRHKEKTDEGDYRLEEYYFNFNESLTLKISQMAKESQTTINMVIQAIWGLVLQKLNNVDDVIFGTVVSGRPSEIDGIEDMVGLFMNTIPTRVKCKDLIFFSELLESIKENSINMRPYEYLSLAEIQALSLMSNRLIDHLMVFENYPIQQKMENIGLDKKIGFKIEDIDTFEHTPYNFNIIIAPGDQILVKYSYNSLAFSSEFVRKIASYYENIILQIADSPKIKLENIELLNKNERNEILAISKGKIELSSLGETLPQIFEERAAQFKEKIALQFNDQQLTYGELNIRANQLARYLSNIGVGVNTIAALMMDRSLEMIISIIAILKVGGGYLPIDPHYPKERIKAVLKDSAATFILTKKNISKSFSYTLLNKIDELDLTPFVTRPREQILHFDYLPKPDRSLVDYQKYHENIGIAMIQKSISLQATRGCPFNCAFCHKIWPKKHVARSAENIFEEIELNYKRGIKKFVFIDDIFNLHHENSSRLMRKIISEKLNVQLFFPNGLRGDILTKDAIDLMIEAGTVNIDLALESASPRIQKLINKNLHLEKFRENIEYIINKYPNILLEMELMIGFPTETEDEALMTLDFLNDLKWIHFPNLNILKIYPNTDMYNLALESGISKKHIEHSINLAYHELPDTLPFPKAFVSQYQFQFMNEYFLSKQRLKHVLPFQMNLLSESELVQKYNSYLPMEIKNFQGLLHTVKLDESDLENKKCRDDDSDLSQRYIQELQLYSQKRKMDKKDAFRILLIDLSLSFSDEKENKLYDMVEEPLGLMYLMTYLNQEFKEKIHGKVVKSRIDFDSYKDLKTLINTFNPDLIGIRTLSFYKDFFHRTVAKIKGWGIQAPVIAGGPYATSDFSILLQDSYVDLVVLGEGEITLAELVKGMMANQNQMPPEDELKNIRGIAFIETNRKGWLKQAKRRVVEWENISILLEQYPPKNLVITIQPENLAYIMYTSGSTGIPKGVMLEHKNLVNLIDFDFKYTSLDFSKILQFHTIGFDASFHEIFSALLSGGKLYLIDEATTTNVPELFDIVEKNRIPTLFLPTSFLRSIFNEEDFIKHFPSCVVHVQTAGEQLVISDTYRECLKLHQLTLHNHYGPAETHVVTTLTLSHNDPIPEIPAIGKPIQNSDIFILDKDFHFLPIGAPGELFIGGIQVGRGYLNKVEFTSERFVKDLFNDNNKTYRTGDLAKYLPDGNIDFLGRIDRQIKIRGFRVEPGEIENTLLGIDFIKNVVVIDRKDVSGEKYLCAYIVSEQNVNLSELKGILLKSLPDYMVPSLFVPMVKLPLTPSGKVDIKALPEPEIKGIRKKYRVPISEMEKILRDIWSDVLGIEKETLSIEENFFDLGGHSLKAIILSSRICKELNLKITLSELFKNATIKEMAEFLKNAKKEEYISIVAVEKKEYYQLSSGQKRLFILQQMETENISYNISGSFILEGEISKEKLEEVFKQLINRHESFRTSFDMINGEPVQKIYDEVEFSIKYYKSEGIEQEVRAPLIEDTIQDFIRPFDLSQAPLMRVGFIKLNETRHIIMLDMHHIITDGISMDVFIKEFMTLYERGKLSKLKIQYKDYSEMQNSKKEREIIKKQEEFWLKEFKEEINVLNLPTDYTRPTIQSFEGDTIFFEIGLEKTKALKRLAEEEGATLFIILFAIFNIFLSRINNQEEIVIGTPIANRRHADLEHIIGMFVNTLALKNFPSGEKSFTNFLKEVRENVFTAFENQDFQFEELVEKLEINRDASRNPLFDVTFVLQNMEISEIKIPGLKLKPYQLKNTISKFDLSFLVVENDEELSFSAEYSTKLFRKETIERFILNFKNIICSVVEDSGVRIYDIEIVSKEEKQQILYEFNDTEVDYPRDKTVQELFEEQVSRTPDNIALVFEDNEITFRALNKRSNQLALVLRDRGVKPDSMVGIMVDRSIEMMVGILGILKSGGAYLPIDSEYPGERIRYMLRDSSAELLLTERKYIDNLSEPFTTILVDDYRVYKNKSNKNVRNINTSRDLAYIMYTSGSIGTPKSVMVEHMSINRLVIHSNYVKFSKKTRILQTGAPVFDATTFEIWGSLLNGGQLFLVRKEEILDAHKLALSLVKNDITTLWLSAPLFNQLLDENKEMFFTLKYLVVGGDILSPWHINKVRRTVSFRQACVTSTPFHVNLHALKEVFNGAFFRSGRFIT